VKLEQPLAEPFVEGGPSYTRPRASAAPLGKEDRLHTRGLEEGEGGKIRELFRVLRGETRGAGAGKGKKLCPKLGNSPAGKNALYTEDKQEESKKKKECRNPVRGTGGEPPHREVLVTWRSES